ncbi:MAG: ROK family protein [Rhodobacteraceae bacterium]|nr:ROK family protein [Paracoccaceae bacterium]
MILCFDIGGSRIKGALSDGCSPLTLLGDVPTPGADFDAFLAALRGFLQGRDLRGVAIAIAGVVSPDTGRIKVANIPCADGRGLADEVRAALGLPVLVLNDADCFALAEARQGAGRGHRNVFGVILGTGVGGGLVLNGQLVTGAGGYAGEWGHGPVIAPPWDFPCGCGSRGCVDAVCGARGLERLHRCLHGVEVPSTVILADWQVGEACAMQTIALWLDLIVPPLAMVTNTVGASILPVGGGLASVMPLLVALDLRLRKAILHQTELPIVVPATCRPEPGLVGAAEAGIEAFAR